MFWIRIMIVIKLEKELIVANFSKIIILNVTFWKWKNLLFLEIRIINKIILKKALNLIYHKCQI